MLKAIMESSARIFKFDEILGLNKTISMPKTSIFGNSLLSDTTIALVFPVFSLNRLLFDQLSRARVLSGRRAQRSEKSMRGAEALGVVSSAKMSTEVSGGITSAKSLMKIRKISGSRNASLRHSVRESLARGLHIANDSALLSVTEICMTIKA